MTVSERSSHWDYFHLLGSFKENVKFNYAVKLFVLFADANSDEGTREYILSRVIQALGAMSDSMRAGAFSLLCTLLVKCPQQCTIDTINKLIKNHFKPSGTANADAEAYVGELLAYKAILQSKLLDKTPEKFSDLANNLMELCLKKSYLHAESLVLLSQITDTTGEEYATDAFLGQFKDMSIATLDKLDYLLKLEQKLDNSETVAHVFDGKKLLSAEAAPEIAVLLSKSLNTSHEFTIKYLEAIAGSKKCVSKFWKAYELHVKDKLTSSKTLDMYLTLLTGTLKQMEIKKQYSSLKVVVSDVAVGTLLKFGKTKAEVTKEVCRCLSEILRSAKDSALSLTVLEKLVVSPGNFSFDEETGTRIVNSVWRTLEPEEIKTFGGQCLEAVVRGENAKNRNRIDALNIFCGLLNKPGCETEWRLEGIKSLLKAGLVVDERVSSEMAAFVRKSFFNLLSVKFPTLPAYGDVLKELVKCLDKCINTKASSLRVKITDEMKTSWTMSQKLIASLGSNLKTKNEGNKIIVQALELLTCFIALKIIYEPKESQFNLSDIQLVFQRITKSQGKTDGPEWIEVVMDLFLNMLSKPNVSNRNIINIVYKTMVPHMNDGAFMQLIAVLEPSYDLNKTEDEEEMEVGDEDVEEGSSEEHESEDSGDSEDSENEDEDVDESEDEEMTSGAFNQEKLQFDLRNALMPTNESDNESIDLDDLDEEQGKQLDATLSAIFKNAMIKKKSSKRESVTSHFRTRVLDLLETYCTIGMPLHHWLTLIPAVLKLANSIVTAKNMSGLKQRVLSFVTKISSLKISDVASEDCEANLLADTLHQLLTEASNATGTSLDLKQHYLELTKFCVKNITHVHTSRIEPLRQSLEPVVHSAVQSFFSEKTSLPNDLMMHLSQYNWYGVHDTALKIIELAFLPTTKPYKRAKGLDLLTGYFKSDRIFSATTAKTAKKVPAALLDALINFKSVLDVKTQTLIAQLAVEMFDGKASTYVNWPKWKQQLPKFLTKPRVKKLSTAFDKMCKKLELNEDRFNNASGAASSKMDDIENTEPAASKKKKRHVDARKLKKESKRLRLAAMDGLEQFSWSTLATED